MNKIKKIIKKVFSLIFPAPVVKAEITCLSANELLKDCKTVLYQTAPNMIDNIKENIRDKKDEEEDEEKPVKKSTTKDDEDEEEDEDPFIEYSI